MGSIRRTYKDSLFCHLFGAEERKRNALELYNALAGTSYEEVDDLELTTISDAIFLGVKNDVSFLIGDEMVLMEHQSTYSPNMPLRGLQYFEHLYTRLIEERELDLYGTRLLSLPSPHYIVLYFGSDERPEREVMRLSDSFEQGPGDVEVTATVLNCNEGRNGPIMEACTTLKGYAHLVALERRNRTERGMRYRDAVRAAVDECIRDGVLAEYLTGHRAEVEDMLFTIQDEERAMRVHWKAVEREAREKGYADGREDGYADGREKGYADGREEGREEGRKSTVLQLVLSGALDSETAADTLGVTKEELDVMLQTQDEGRNAD